MLLLVTSGGEGQKEVGRYEGEGTVGGSKESKNDFGPSDDVVVMVIGKTRQRDDERGPEAKKWRMILALIMSQRQLAVTDGRDDETMRRRRKRKRMTMLQHYRDDKREREERDIQKRAPSGE